MKILAIDFGDSRTGIAISDALCFMAGRSFVVKEKSFPQLVEKLVEIITTENPTEIILGYPKNMDNSEGPRAIKTKGLADILTERLNMPIILWDERTTTISAHKILSETGKKHKKHRATVDAVAASIILENYLTFKSLKP